MKLCVPGESRKFVYNFTHNVATLNFTSFRSFLRMLHFVDVAVSREKVVKLQSDSVKSCQLSLAPELTLLFKIVAAKSYSCRVNVKWEYVFGVVCPPPIFM